MGLAKELTARSPYAVLASVKKATPPSGTRFSTSACVSSLVGKPSARAAAAAAAAEVAVAAAVAFVVLVLVAAPACGAEPDALAIIRRRRRAMSCATSGSGAGRGRATASEKYAQYTAMNAIVAQRHVTAMPPRITGCPPRPSRAPWWRSFSGGLNCFSFEPSAACLSCCRSACRPGSAPLPTPRRARGPRSTQARWPRRRSRTSRPRRRRRADAVGSRASSTCSSRGRCASPGARTSRPRTRRAPPASSPCAAMHTLLCDSLAPPARTCAAARAAARLRSTPTLSNPLRLQPLR